MLSVRVCRLLRMIWIGLLMSSWLVWVGYVTGMFMCEESVESASLAQEFVIEVHCGTRFEVEARCIAAGEDECECFGLFDVACFHDGFDAEVEFGVYSERAGEGFAYLALAPE